MIKASFWLKITVCSFLFAISIFGIFGFNNDSKIKDTIIKNTDAAETSSCKGPADVILVIDRSASMDNFSRFGIAKTASVNFIDKLFTASPDDIYGDNAYHQVGLVAFQNLIDNEELNKSGDYIKNVINQSDGILGDAYPEGYRRTSLAISTAKDSLDLDLSNANHSATKTMIVITDGPPYYNPDDAIAFANSADSAGVRIISVGLKLDSISDEIGRTEAEETAAEEFIKNIASAPFDCYYASDSGAVLSGCNSISADNLADALNGVYNSITAAICDESSPTVSISREPSGTLYNVDNLIIISTAIDDIGFNSHTIRWSNNWSSPEDIEVIECDDLTGTVIESGVVIECSTGSLGTFSSGTSIDYKSSVTDANENEASIEEPDLENVIVANVTLTIPALLRNKPNTIKAVISNYGGNDEIFVTIDAPVLAGIEIDKASMICTSSGSTRTCVYVFNPGCDWTDGITGGFANNIDVNIYFYAQSDDVGIRQIASSENNILASGFEGSGWTGTCTDTPINNDCDYDIFNDPIIDSEEELCDISNPIIGISRDPVGDIYDLESDGVTPMTVTLESIAGDSNGIKQHIIYYKIDDGSLQVAFDCNDANADSLCDEDAGQNINSISATIGPFNAGEEVDYYSTAVDYSGNNNTTSTVPESFIVKNRECEGVGDLGDCLVTPGGKCCNGVCNASATNSGPLGPYNIDSCAKLSCDGIELKWIPNSFTGQCSESGESDSCYFFTSDPLVSPFSPPDPYDNNGCEEREYRCDSGYCEYGYTDRKVDGCDTFGPNPLIWKDFQCDAFGQCEKLQEWEDGKCDISVSTAGLEVWDSGTPSILINNEVEVLDTKTDPISLKANYGDTEGDVVNCELKWKINGAEQSVDCGTCPAGNFCNHTKEVGPFVDRDFIEYRLTVEDENGNIKNDPVLGWGSFTVRDDECYNIPDSYIFGGSNEVNLTVCNSGSGKCCGGHCDSSRTESSVYNDECTVDACSGESWIENNTNEFGETLDDTICGVSNTCFDYYSPNVDFYSGCMNGGNKCSSGQCDTLSTLTSYPTCNVNLLTSYDCDDYETGSCQERTGGTNIDCSDDADYDNDSASGGTDCNCDCNGYDIEEKVYSSLSFDGVDDHVKFSDSVELLRSGSTLTFWAKTNTSGSMTVFAKNNSEYYSMIEFRESSFRLEPDLNQNDCSWAINRDINWHFYALVFENNKSFLWQDDNYIGETGTYTEYSELRDNLTLYNIGMKSRYVGYFNGSIDDVRIYNRVLYSHEIEDHYNGMFVDDTDLVGHWDFDEGTGEIAEDSSGKGNDGSLSNVDGKLYNMNDSDWISGKYGNGLDFDGSDDYVKISDSASLSFGAGSSFTFSTWIKTSICQSSGSKFVEKKLGNDSIQIQCYPSDNKAKFSVRDSNGISASATGTTLINDNQWHHLIGVKNGNNLHIYVDGSLEGSANPSFIGNWDDGDIRIGTSIDGGARYVDGLIDEVRIYDRALLYDEEDEANSEIYQHYRGAYTDNSGLVGYWDFNESSGTIAEDSSGNGPQWVKYGNGDDEDENGNVIDVLNRNVPAPWQVCTDGKNNDCDEVADDYDGDTGISNCDGELYDTLAGHSVSILATAMNRTCVIDEDCVEGSDVFSVGNVITVNDIDIERAENDFTIIANASDDFGIHQTIIEWTTDNWANVDNKTCNGGVCEVCVEGGSCGEDNDDILSSSLSAGNVFSFRVCAWDSSINYNQKCTDYYSIIIEASNSAPEVTDLSIRDHNFCTDGLEYVLEWEFSDFEGHFQESYEIQIKEDDNDFSTGLVVNVKKTLSSSYYQILSGDFVSGEEIEYGEDKNYYWRIRATDNCIGGYEETSEWVEYNDLSDSDGDGNSATFTTPIYNYPQVDFSAKTDLDVDCLYETGYEHIGTEDRCDFGENITFSDESVYVECDSPNDAQCIISSISKCDVSTGLCVFCDNVSQCAKFGAGYKCEGGICEPPDGFICNPDNSDCKTADAARCEEGICVSCDDDSQCSNEKFGTTGINYFCNSAGVCDDSDRREWYFYGSDIGDPDSVDPNPVNNYIESESKTYNVIFKVKDIIGNTCYEIKKILLGGRDYPKWNESSVSN